ncbi:MAG: phosphatidylserine decarboxylase, partial [Gemmatimonadota bacterium]|nr:phosphatidylserine decarboxylase [Gemmatimonadota bacterium]
VTDHHVDETVSQGERLGLIRFGSRVDTFLPLDAQPKVSVGEKVHAGVTVLAEWDR